MRLIILHYHLRPGGIRRIIEQGTPALLQHYGGRIREVVVAAGEARDEKWNSAFEERLPGTRLEWFIEPSFGYFSEQQIPAGQLTRKIRASLQSLFEGAERSQTVVWAHNLGIARNLPLARELGRACEAHGITLLAHHHDWWFDNRWLRWPEIQRCGFRSLASAARAVFPQARQVRHCTINKADAAILERHLGRRVFWLPNLSEAEPAPSPDRIQAARRWLRERIGNDQAPVWILPCRLLRRKNIAEALLLKRLIRPDAWLVTTGGASSADEIPYGRALQAAAEKHGWQMRLGLLAGEPAGHPSIPELLAASECVVLSSVQEGFGLPYLEAAAARRPLIARSLPNIAPDLEEFGFHFPHYYEEVLVPLELFDWKTERARQQKLFAAWKRQMPAACRKLAGIPPLLKHGIRAVPFSRLTLTAQLEILALPRQKVWDLCAPLNGFLAEWRELAERGHLVETAWPAGADRWLSAKAYAARWAQGVEQPADEGPSAADASAAQRDFIRWKLGADYLYPLLWAVES